LAPSLSGNQEQTTQLGCMVETRLKRHCPGWLLSLMTSVCPYLGSFSCMKLHSIFVYPLTSLATVHVYTKFLI
jgi:hypothetical protein